MSHTLRGAATWIGMATLVVCASGQQTPPPQPNQPAARISTIRQQVDVTATRTSAAAGEPAETVYGLTREDLKQYPAVTLDEALRQHAGFELFRRSSTRVQNPTSSGVSLRGLGSTAASRTLVLEDEAPLNDPFGGWVHWNENPAQTVGAVTLVSGGGSDLYGSSALGGVIEVVPEQPGKTSFEASAAVGSQDTADYQASVSAARAQVAGMLAGEVLRTAGYVQVDPTLAGSVDTPSNVHSETFRTELERLRNADRGLFLTGNLLNEARGNGTPLQTNGTRLWRYLSGYDTPEGHRATARVRAFGSDEGYRQSFSSIAASRNSETLTRRQRLRTQELGASGDTTVSFGPLTAVAGGDLRDIRARADETPIPGRPTSVLQDLTARQRYIGGFGELLASRKRWSGAAFLRADRASNLDTAQTSGTSAGPPTRTSPANRTEVVLSPRVGLTRGFADGWTVHASGFRAFRAPTMNELYRTGQVGQETTLPNPALQSERATGWEVGTETVKLPASSSLQATYFWTEINRPVSAVLVSHTATTITNKRENLGQIRSEGVELSLHLRSGKPISGAFGYQYANAVVTRFSAQPALVGKWIPDVPRQSATGQIRAAGEKLGELTLAMRFGGQAFDDSSNIFPLAKFFEMDLSGQRRFGKHAEAFFLIENLTDSRQQVARTPVLTLGSPVFAQGGLRYRLGPR